ncbi:hypothetical protein GKZ68_21075 (plasmid) [Hymenobacter sp. BRD128]|uniref:hypothetical protein n=1 Tax=Hymenobacter sp. BRD128 TaxID=2675878 RepID=UPI0015647815|nr:hypothetical protein [Hymenobacter sp. BRD128]QKG59179.1 hypothetical protein GKZ68_21075 [Hymenobacter sp. BRD128]
MDSGALRAVYEHALHLLKRAGLTKILTDHGQMAPFLAADREWMTRTWVPRAVAEAGYNRCAIVESNQVFNGVLVTTGRKIALRVSPSH